MQACAKRRPTQMPSTAPVLHTTSLYLAKHPFPSRARFLNGMHRACPVQRHDGAWHQHQQGGECLHDCAGGMSLYGGESYSVPLCMGSGPSHTPRCTETAAEGLRVGYPAPMREAASLTSTGRCPHAEPRPRPLQRRKDILQLPTPSCSASVEQCLEQPPAGLMGRLLPDEDAWTSCANFWIKPKKVPQGWRVITYSVHCPASRRGTALVHHGSHSDEYAQILGDLRRFPILRTRLV